MPPKQTITPSVNFHQPARPVSAADSSVAGLATAPAEPPPPPPSPNQPQNPPISPPPAPLASTPQPREAPVNPPPPTSPRRPTLWLLTGLILLFGGLALIGASTLDRYLKSFDSEQALTDYLIELGLLTPSGALNTDRFQGEPGDKGDQGDRGTPGDPGATTTATGPRGLTGATGATGSQGLQGEAGCLEGECISLQSSTPGTQETGHLSISGSGLFGGSVGIGTVSPQDYGSNYRSLEIKGNTPTTGGVFQSSSSDSSVKVRLFVDSALGFAGTATNHAFILQSNGAEAVRILPNGNVGIGTTAPGAKLHVQGAASATTAIFRANATTPGNIIEAQTSAAAAVFTVSSFGEVTFAPTTDGQSNARFKDIGGTTRLNQFEDGFFERTGAAATDDYLRGVVSGDSAYRFILDSDGRMLWGGGTTATDTNLYRAGADILRTDDMFQALSEVRAQEGQVGRVRVGVDPATAMIFFGNLNDTNLYRSAANELKTDDRLVVASTLKLETLGAAQATHLCVSSGAGGSDIGACTADYAEWYPADVGVEPGDIVAISNIPNPVEDETARYLMTKAATNTRGRLLGAISPYDGGAGEKKADFYKPLSLNGRIPVKVSTENGAIAPGDPITISSQAGVGMKATTSGRVVGIALEGYSGGGVGSVLVFVNPHWYQPNPNKTLQATNAFDTLNVSGLTSVKDLKVTGTAIVYDLVVQGHVVGNPDTRGSMTVPTGQSHATHKFTKAFGSKPYITLTPKQDVGNLRWWVEETTTGFTVKLSAPAPQELRFNYQVQQ